MFVLENVEIDLEYMEIVLPLFCIYSGRKKNSGLAFS